MNIPNKFQRCWIDGKDLWTGSITGVWAIENTYAAIFDAMRCKETFATSGPRIKVRMFDGANLDRIQIIKGWVDKHGDLNEKIIAVVWSGDRVGNAAGKLPPVGNTVD